MHHHHQVISPHEHPSTTAGPVSTPGPGAHRNALKEFESGFCALVQNFKTSLNLDASNEQVTRAHNTCPPSSTQATYPQDIFTPLESQPLRHHTATAPLTTAQFESCNELSSENDPFAGLSYPDLVEGVPDILSAKPACGNNMVQEQKANKPKKKKKKNVAEAEADYVPTFPTGPHFQYPQIEYATNNVSMADPRGGQLHLPCIACLEYWWVVRFDSPIIPSKVIIGDHERAMGFTICSPECGTIPIDASKTKESGQHQYTMTPLHPSMAESARRSRNVDATTITDGKRVLFVSQDEICGMAKFGGTIKCFERGVEFDWT